VYARQKKLPALNIGECASTGRYLTVRRLSLTEKIRLSVNLKGLKLKNPLIAASGTFGFAEDFEKIERFKNEDIGAVTLKSISMQPRAGNPPPRIVETPAGIINSVGLANPGIKEFKNRYIKEIKKAGTVFIANIVGFTVKEYGDIAREFDDIDGIDALEVNISCPNVKKGGIAFGTDPKQSFKVIEAVRKNTKKLIISKLTPNVTDIVDTLKACIDAGTDMVSLINTVNAMAIDIDTRRPVLVNNKGGLSGPAIKPIAVYLVNRAFNYIKEHKLAIPIIGMGGVMTYEDALEFIIAGANAVSIGTGSFYDPFIYKKINKDLSDYLRKNKINDINKLVGSVTLN
jgi:dihydroorotate dehydrogenase (NAD+) catalytic subunit